MGITVVFKSSQGNQAKAFLRVYNMINAKTVTGSTGKQEIKLTSTNNQKSIRVYFVGKIIGFQNKNNSTKYFDEYHEGLEFLIKKGW